MQAQELVKGEEQAVPPPEPTVPEPTQPRQRGRNTNDLTDAMADVKLLAQRVGGLEKLRQIVDTLISIKE